MVENNLRKYINILPQILFDVPISMFALYKI